MKTLVSREPENQGTAPPPQPHPRVLMKATFPRWCGVGLSWEADKEPETPQGDAGRGEYILRPAEGF